MSGFPDAARICASADYFPVHIDLAAERFLFAQTNEVLIRNAAFLDGRVPFSTGSDQFSVSFADAFSWLGDQTSAAATRLIAHMSFCGSTLLANTLDRSEACLAYREPQLLVELATARAQAEPCKSPQPDWQKVIAFSLRQLQQTWSDQPSIVKPSNWVNTLLGDLSSASPDMKAVVATIGLEDYLIANLRGGKPRLNYSLNLLNHFLSSSDAHRSRVLDIERGGLTSMQRLLRLLVIVYETQDAVLRRDLPKALRLSKADLQSDLFGAARLASAELKIAPDMPALRSEIRRSKTVHAKDANQSFSLQVEVDENEQVLASYADEIDEAMDWGSDIARSVA